MTRTTFSWLLLALAGSLAAQGPAYVTTRDGCNGGAVGRCIVQNESPMSFQLYSQPYDYAFAVTNTSGAPISVLGFEFYTTSITGSPEVVDSFVYTDNSGPGALVHTAPSATPIAQGTMTVNGFNAWWNVSVYPPPVMQPGEAFWIGFNPRSRVSPPQNASGVAGPASSHYRASNVNGGRWTVLNAPGAPSFRVRCTAPAPAVAGLTALDLPRIGQPFRLQATGGDPSSIGFMIWALSGTQWQGMPTPFSMAPFGAPDCFIHTSTNEALLLLLDAQGTGTFTANLPASTGLLNVVFFNQAAVSNATANAARLLATNMGRGVVGS